MEAKNLEQIFRNLSEKVKRKPGARGAAQLAPKAPAKAAPKAPSSSEASLVNYTPKSPFAQ